MTVTRFDGATLPPGWTAIEPAGSSIVMENGHCAIKTDPGANFDSLSSGITVPQGPRISIPVVGDFDYAVGLAAATNTAPDQGVDLLALDVANEDGIRFSQYVTNIGNRLSLWYGRRNTPEATGNITLTNPPSELYGPRVWMRLSKIAGTWTFQSSHTGKPGTWHTHVAFANSFNPTTFEIDAVAFGPDANGREQRVAVFVDMAGRGDDATTEPPATTNSTLFTADFTGPAVPSELVATTNASGTVVVSGGIATLTTDSNIADSYAWLETVDPLPMNHGLLVRYRFPQPSAFNTFAGIGLRGSKTTDLPASKVLPDKYRPGTGTLCEINGNDSFSDIIRILDAHPVSLGETYDGTREFIGFSNRLEDLDGPVAGNSGLWIWMRAEIIDGYFRWKFWNDGELEPTAWTYEGEGYAQQFGRMISFAMGHNDSTTGAGGGTASIDLSNLIVYEVQAASVDPVAASPLALDLTIGPIDEQIDVSETANSVALQVAFGTPTVTVEYQLEANPVGLELSIAPPTDQVSLIESAISADFDLIFGTPVILETGDVTAEPVQLQITFGPVAIEGDNQPTVRTLVALPFDLELTAIGDTDRTLTALNFEG